MRRHNYLPVRFMCLLLILSMLPIAGLASLQETFPLPEPMPQMPFTDLNESAWYYENVHAVYALELMDGMTPIRFAPDYKVPLSQGVTMAVRVYEHYRGIEEPEQFPEGPWYTYYFQQAKTYGLLPEALYNENPLRNATRAELAAILYKCLPEEELPIINENVIIPDYTVDDPYYEGVLTLCQSGVLVGDNHGRFWPDNLIRRSELAALITRIVLPDYRITVQPPTEIKGGMDAFLLPDPMPKMPFTDVPNGMWYHPYIHSAYALGLVDGMTPSFYAPKGSVQLSQALAVAVRIHERYLDIPDASEGYGKPWYLYYLHRAQDYGILPKPLADEDFTRPASRVEVAAILCGALPKEELPSLRTVTEIPDYTSEDTYYSQIHMLYEAGVMGGMDPYGTLDPDSYVRRSELAALITRLTQPSKRLTSALLPVPPKQIIETYTYGKSGMGKDLTAYRMGDGENVLVLTFAIHGWEDGFSHDGKLLVETAEALHKDLTLNYDKLIRDNNWTVWILPCLNPDGVYDGWTHNGPGRCTVKNYYGNDKGIDMNRCFPYKFQPEYGNRNYTGKYSAQCSEAQALMEFTKKVKGNGANVLIDTHGWFQQTIYDSSKGSRLMRIFREEFPENRPTAFARGYGYYSAWANYILGYDGCLFEFPELYSASAFHSNDYQAKYIRCIHDLLENYNSMSRSTREVIHQFDIQEH